MNVEWARGPQWRSTKQGLAWGPVIADTAAAWSELEVISVSEGLRDAALVFVPTAQIGQVSRESIANGLWCDVVAVDGPRARVVIRQRDKVEATAACLAGDNAALGRALGYPPCCIEHFDRTWARGVDHVAAMPTVEGPWTANVLHRAIGVRLVPHLPCSGDCAATVALGEQFLDLGLRTGLYMTGFEVILRQPVRWDARHGIAMTETPHWRTLGGCMVGPQREVRERKGTALPATPAPWRDNGFTSEAAMNAAHAVVMQAVGETDSALDLGCGDGLLLSRLQRGRGPAEAWVGVESDAGRASRGAMRHPGTTIHQGDIAELVDFPTPVPRFGVVILSVCRILEMPAERRDAFVASLFRVGHRVVVSTYGDEREPIDVLCGKAGLAPAGPIDSGGVTHAVEVARG